MGKILTISVAAYNLGNMIEDNLNSFLDERLLNDIEVIVTDDGSKDNTSCIIKEYELKYPETIKYIYQKNKGPGSTVNSGINYATGKYFKMVDGDDWVETENLVKLVEYLKKSEIDLVLNDYIEYDDIKKEIIGEQKITGITTNKKYKIDKIVDSHNIRMHSSTYKTKILKDGIKLDNGFYTDMEYLLFPLKKVKNFIYFNYPVYVYRLGRADQSVSIPKMQKNILQHDLVIKRLITDYEKNKNNISSNLTKYLEKRIDSMISTHISILFTFKNNKNELKNFINYIENNSKNIFKIVKKQKKVKFLIKYNFKFLFLGKIFIKFKYFLSGKKYI